MALVMGLAEIDSVASNEKRPFCGYSPADVVPPVKDEVARGWTIRGFIWSSALYTEHFSLPCRKNKVEKVQAHYLYVRNHECMVKALRIMQTPPWIANADYQRLAHGFWERRVATGRNSGPKL